MVARFESGGPEHQNEVIELAKVVAAYGGNYASHIGSEGYEQEKEFEFIIRVAEEAKIPVHIFHFKIRAKENWGTDRQVPRKGGGRRARRGSTSPRTSTPTRP